MEMHALYRESLDTFNNNEAWEYIKTRQCTKIYRESDST